MQTLFDHENLSNFIAFIAQTFFVFNDSFLAVFYGGVLFYFGPALMR